MKSEHQTTAASASAGLNGGQAEDLVRRCVALPTDRRRLFLDKLAGQGIAFSQLPIPKGLGEAGDLPLSPVQQGLWILAQLAPDSAAYHIAGGLRLRGYLDHAALRHSFEALAARHDALRTSFHADGEGRPFQRVHESSTLDLTLHAADTDEAAQSFAEAQARRPFNLAQGPLWRVSLLRRGEDCHELGLTLHHLIADGWSLNRLLAEFAECYAAAVAGGVAALPDLPIRYGDYAIWQRSWLEAGESERQAAWWRGRLGDEHPLLELPADRPRPTQASHQGGRVALRFDDDLSTAVQRLARELAATPFMVLLAGFYALLYRHSGQHDLRIGIPSAGRDRPETEGLVGYCVNTLVFRVELDGRLTGEALLERVRQTALAAQAHAHLPFEQLVEALKPERNLSHNPLFQVLFNHQQRDVGALAQLPGLAVESIDRDNGAAQFDLSLDTEEDGQGRISGVFTYATDLFDAASVEQLRDHYLRLLRQLSADPTRRLATWDLLAEAEQAQLEEWNRWIRRWPEDEPVAALIRRQALAQPQATALVCGAEKLSYAELEAQANRLAHHLLGLGLGRESVLGVALPRSARMIVAMLGVFKTGAAFVPLDAELPPTRLTGLLQAAGTQCVLTESSLSPRLPPDLPRLLLDGEDWMAASVEPPAVPIHPQQLAYLIYTSGSTGTPKGVAVSHGPLAAHCLAIGERYGLSPKDRALHFATVGFDAAMEQWMAPLIYGACLVVRGPQLWSAEQACEVLEQQRISWFEMPPAYLNEVAQWALACGKQLNLRACSVGGEAVPRESLATIRQAVGSAPILNGYGPTETLITPLVWTAYPDTPCESVYAPIGTAVGERTLYVLDADLNRLPIGAVGELHIGGNALARGYHGQPDLSAERFIPDPYGPPGARLYRTGDRVRQRQDGIVEYLGRADNQVKLRGYRIELGEVEAQLLAEANVTEAAAIIVGEGPHKRLVAYAAGQAISAETLKSQLRERLPDYLVPAQIISLERLPKLPSGKLDRKALPVPQWQHSDTQNPPSTEREQLLAELWAEVLGGGPVGVDDNFFELGGDSILALQVVSRARRAGLILSPADLFRWQTVAALARMAQSNAAPSAATQTASGKVPLSPIQAAFFETEIPQRGHWSLSLLLECVEPLDTACLDEALKALLKHHDSLRLRYRQEGGAWSQAYADPATATAQTPLMQAVAVDAAELVTLAQKAQRSLDLAEGPLLRALHIRLTDGGERLLLVVHHLVVDGVSWRILLEDLHTAYRQRYDGQAISLPPRTASFQAWTQCLSQLAASNELANELAYWEKQLQGGVAIPQDFNAGTGSYTDASEVTVRLDAAYTRKLLQETPATYRTRINDLLLAALARVLGRWNGLDDIVVELESHGREDRFPGIDLSRSVGWFTSQFPVRLAAIAKPAAAIKTVKEQLRQVPGGGLGYGVLRQLAAPALRECLHSLPRPAVSFNYFGQFDAVDSGLFRPAAEGRGDDHDPAAPLEFSLEINGQVLDDELALRWRFSRNQYREETVSALAQAYGEDLRVLIDHCLSCDGSATPSDFPLAGLNQAELDALPLDLAVLEDLYPASPMQQGLLFHALYEPEDRSYVNQLTVSIEGLDEGRFTQAWREVVRRHPILRTAFVSPASAATPLQAVYKQIELDVEILDWQNRPVAAEALAALAADDHQLGFDPAQAPLQRLRLVRLPDGRHQMIWTCHHLLLDGWSTSLLLGEVLEIYQGLAPRPVLGTYRDYIGWLGQQDSAASAVFWQERLALLDGPTRLAGGSGNPAKQSRGLLRRQVDAATTEGLRRFAAAQHLTLNTLLQGAWTLLLQGHTGKTAVAFGATVAGRPAGLAGVEQMLGLFINTLPVVLAPRPHWRLADWLRTLQADNLALREHEYTPLYEIQHWAGFGEALFDTLLVFENYPVDQALRNTGGGLRFGEPEHIDTTHYPLTLNISLSDGLGLAFGYAHSHFDPASVAGLAQQFEHLLRQMLRQPQQPLGDLTLADAAELRFIARCNDTSRAYPADLLPALLQRQAEATPTAQALWFAGQSLTYGELERRANRLAQRLRRLGVGPDCVVGIAVERSLELLVGLLGILKAGGAYLPLDPDYPAERLALMLEDSGIGIVLTRTATLGGLALPDGLLRLDPADESLLLEPDTAPEVDLHPEHLAYVIYTSGSTGRPKGAGNTHAALANRLRWMQEAYGLQGDDTVLQKTPISFDVSVWELFWPLMTGARLAIAKPTDHRDPARLSALMVGQAVTTLHFVPSMLQEFLAQCEQPVGYPSLRRIVCSGEALTAELRDRVFQRLPGVALHNLYGPTEAAIDVSHWTCRETDGGRVPIGRPIANLSLHVLDTAFNPLPVGVAGELYLGGAGLARAYHHRPGLTAERFVPDPEGQGSRLYRTGDKARRQADGSIDYLGRLDNQIKLRGLRIELGEIESVLLGDPQVREAAVLLREGVAGPCLVAYVATTEQRLDSLRQRLQAQLPDYMVPACLLRVDSLPKTPNGKLDRKALPEPAWQARAYRPAETATEQALAAIWQDLLGVEQVGLDDHFFDLGGHSLLAMKLSGRVKQAFSVELSVRQVFESAELAAMAAAVERGRQQPASPDALAAALAELDQLSPDALASLLAGEPHNNPKHE